MSLTRPERLVAMLREPAFPLLPPGDPDSQPPSGKRLRLEEPGGVSEVKWRLPLVPRLSEEEKVWELPPRPFEALLLPRSAVFGNSTDSRVEQCNRRPQKNRFEMRSWLQPPPVQSFGSVEPGLYVRGVFREQGRERSGAEGGPPGPDASPHRTRGAERPLVQGRHHSQRDSRRVKHPERPLSDVTFHRETGSAFQDVKSRCHAHSVSPSAITSASASTLKIPESQSQRAKLSCFGRGSPRRNPECPTTFTSELRPVCLKGPAKRKRGADGARVGGRASVDRSPMRWRVKKQKLEEDEKMVAAGTASPECCARSQRSLSSQGVCVGREHSIRLHGRRPSPLGADVRGSERPFPVKPQQARPREADAWLHSAAPTTVDTPGSWGCQRSRISTKEREKRWIVANYTTRCENVKNPGEILNLLETDRFGEVDAFDTNALNSHAEQSKLFVVGALSRRKASLSCLWLKAQGENHRLRPLSYIPRKGMALSSIFESFVPGRLCFRGSISGNEKGSILHGYEILKFLKQFDFQNLIARNMADTRKNSILSVYFQTSVSKPLMIILKTNIASSLNSFDVLPRIENDSTLEEEYICKWIVYLNSPEDIVVEKHIVYRGRTLTYSKLLENNMKPMLEQRKLFKTEHIFEASEKNNSFSLTTKNKHFPIFEIRERIPVLMDRDDMDKISLTKEISYKSVSCPEQAMSMKNWDHCSTNAVTIYVKSLAQITQNSHEYINGKFYEVNIHNQDLGTKRRVAQNKISSFNFKHTFEDFFHVRQQAMLTSHSTKRSKQTSSAIATQLLNLGSWLKSEIEGHKHDLIVKEEEKAIVLRLTNIDQEKNRFYSMDGMFSVRPVSLVSKKVNVGKTKYVNQKNLADRNEDGSILQERELANLKHFHPKNDSTDCVNHHFETDLSVGNNECFQDLSAKCLSTELTIATNFEMKSQFDLVLEELRMFHEISKENEILSPMETNNGQGNYFGENNGVEMVKMEIRKDLEMGTVTKTCPLSLPCEATAVPNVHKRHQSVFKWKTAPKNTEQEVPNDYCCPRTPEEELLYSTSEEGCEKPSPKRPAFLPDGFEGENPNYFLKGGSYFSYGISRLLPLKTCSRPIRIGLSRKAKLKQLHAYLK